MTSDLSHWRIVGFERRVTSPAPGVVVVGGTCALCGEAIVNCFLAQRDDGEIVTVGETCAEKVGLDSKGLAQLRRERNAELRAERDRANAAWWAQENERRAELERQQSTELEALYGAHGTETRYVSGECRCDECRAAAPHGTEDRFWSGCSCADCVSRILEQPGYYRDERPVLVSLQTGQVAKARIVDGVYGPSWQVLDRSGAVIAYVPCYRKRRETVAKRGYVYATAEYVLRRSPTRSEPAHKVRRLTTPTVDDWGEPIQ